jgi:hypothetical protein
MTRAYDKNGNILKGFLRFVRRGSEKSRREAMQRIISRFNKSGKDTLVVDGAYHPEEIRFLKEFCDADIKQVHLAMPFHRRVSLVQLRGIGKGGGSMLRTRVWLGIMGLLHLRILGFADMKAISKSGAIVLNEGTKADLDRKVDQALRQ